MKRIIAATLLAASSAVNAGDFEVDYGLCKYTRPAEGIWWNSKYQTRMDLRTGCGQIGYLSERSGTGFRLAYVNLGATQWDNVAAKRDDEQHLKLSGKFCSKSTGKGCLATYAGSQRVEGLSLGVTHAWEHVNVEAGVLGYYSEVHIFHQPQYTKTMNTFRFTAVNWTPYIGAQVRAGMFHISARVYNDLQSVGKCGDCLGGTNGAMYQITAGIHKEF